jgi:anti-anti-sigma regulatory factor
MESPSGIEVGVAGPVRIVRVTGRGTHLNSSLLKRYARQAIEQKFPLHLELGGCVYMDSTFLGMLAGLAVRSREKGLPRVRVLAAGARVRDLMANLGIDRLFDFDAAPAPGAPALQPLEGPAPAPADKARDVLDAHRALAAADPSNAVKFRDVIAMLEEEVSRPPPP